MALPPIEIRITADPKEAKAGLAQVEKAQDSLEAATLRFKKQTEQLTKAQKIGLITQDKQKKLLDQAEREYTQAARAAAKYAGATAEVTRASRGATGAFGRLGNMSNSARAQIQNTSFQIQDIIVQMQSGTAASTALAQQLPQLAGAFGAVGAAIGVGFALGIPAVTVAMKAMGQEAVSLEKQLESLDDVLSRLKETNDDVSLSAQDIIERFGGAAVRAREYALALAELRVQEARDQIDQMGTSLQGVADGFAAAARAGNEQRMSLDQILSLYNQLRDANGIEEQRAAMSRLVSEMDRAGIALSELPPSARKTVSEFLELSNKIDEAERAASKLNQEIGNGSRFANLLQSAVDAITFDGAISGASTLQGALARAYSTAVSLMNTVNAVRQPGEALTLGAGVPSALGEFDTRIPFSNMPATPAGTMTAVPVIGTSGRGGRGRGGGSSGGRPTSAIEGLIESLQTQRETVEAWREESMRLLELANQQELDIIGGHNEAKLRLEEEYARRLAEIQTGYQGDGLTQAKTFFGDMANAMQGGSEKMLRIAKTFAAAESLIDSYQAYTRVLKDPTLPWFARIPAAVSVLSAGMGMVNAIKGVSAGGGSSGAASGAAGGGGAATGAAGSASQGPLQVRLEQIDPDAVFTGRSIGVLLDRLQDEAGARGNRGVQFL